MNISTYEARIAALEAQLGPGPGPAGPETGLVSVVVTPDITLSDGTSLNSILATYMPMTSGRRLENFVQEFPTPEYTVTITPGSSWKAQFIDESDVGPVGEAISKVYNVSENTLTFDVLASSDPLDESAPFAELEVLITKRA